MMKYAIIIPTILLAFAFQASVLLAGEETSSRRPEIIDKLRENQRLTLEEKQYTERIKNKFGYTDSEVADYVERNWKLSEGEIDATKDNVSNKLKLKSNDNLRDERTFDFRVGLPIAIGFVFSAVMIAYVLLKRRIRRRRNEEKLRQGCKVSEMIKIIPEEQSDLPPGA
ncbi:MAG: hypothetical protein JXR97_16055 [Planctomycetes bacterium]|nr:hypothetical protein [Planctomycetota bacterium]